MQVLLPPQSRAPTGAACFRLVSASLTLTTSNFVPGLSATFGFFSSETINVILRPVGFELGFGIDFSGLANRLSISDPFVEKVIVTSSLVFRQAVLTRAIFEKS